MQCRTCDIDLPDGECPGGDECGYVPFEGLGQPYRSLEDVPSLHAVVLEHFKRKAENGG